jgi:hypothetical protein
MTFPKKEEKSIALDNIQHHPSYNMLLMPQSVSHQQIELK